MCWKTPSSIALFCTATILLAITPSAQAEVPRLAQRTGQERCWAQFETGPNQFLCLPHRLWLQSFTAQGNWAGKWSAFSPPLLGQTGSKATSYRWIAERRLDEEPTDVLHRIRKELEERRETLSEWLKKDGSDLSGMFASLLLNERSAKSQIFREVGFIHLLSASGLHLLALSYWISWIVGMFFRRVSLPTRMAVPIRRILVSSSWLWCWLLAGMKLSMVRPLLLLGLRSLAGRLGLRWKRGAPLVLAFLIDLAVADAAGRLYYFVAISSALLISEGRSRRFHLLLSTWFVTSAFTLIGHRLLPLGSVVISAITLPWIVGVIYPLLVLRSVVAVPIGPLLGWTQDGFNFVARLLLTSETLWWFSPVHLLLAGAMSTLLFLVPVRWRMKVGAGLCAVCVLFGFFPEPWTQASETAGKAERVIQLDVGQGDAALVLDGSGIAANAGLIDTGSGKLISPWQWLDLFSNLGIFRLNWVAVTHLDEDHSGGILKISTIIPVDCVTTSGSELQSPRGLRWRNILESRGVHVTSHLSECIPYPALPPRPSRAGHSANENMSAFLIPLRGGGFYLSAGDATAQDEIRIGKWAKGVTEKLDPGPRILKISHHGSRTSSDPLFLKEIRPDEAWISVGVANHYGHPSPLILKRLGDAKIPIRRTDQEGALEEQEAKAGGDRRRR